MSEAELAHTKCIYANIPKDTFAALNKVVKLEGLSFSGDLFSGTLKTLMVVNAFIFSQ